MHVTLSEAQSPFRAKVVLSCWGFFVAPLLRMTRYLQPHAFERRRTPIPTIRQKIISLLEADPLDAHDLSSALGIREKEVYPLFFSRMRKLILRRSSERLITSLVWALFSMYAVKNCSTVSGAPKPVALITAAITR